MKKTVYSWMNPRPATNPPEMGETVTIPGQPMSMRTMLDRYRRGMPLDVKMKVPQYHNGEFPDLSQMDLSEIEALKKYASQQIVDLRQQLQKQEQEKAQKERQNHLAEIEALKKQLQEKQLQNNGVV